MRDSIHIVGGSTGEYSDLHEWVVCWFSDKETAESFAQHLREQLAASLERHSHLPKWESYRQARKEMESLDPDLSIDYNGVTYGVFELREGPEEW